MKQHVIALVVLALVLGTYAFAAENTAVTSQITDSAVAPKEDAPNTSTEQPSNPKKAPKRGRGRA